KVNPVQPDPGIRITVWDGATFHSVATNRLADQDYLIRLARERGQGITIRSHENPQTGAALDRHFRTSFQTDPAAVSVEQKQELCRRLYSTISGRDPRIAMTQVVCQTHHEYRIFCDVDRLLSADTVRTLIFAVTVASATGRQVQNFGYRFGSGWDTAEQTTDDWATGLVDETVAALSAEPLTPGEYTCILSPDVAGILAHESFGHGCELDTMMRGAARALYYIGRRVGSDLVNIVDEPGRPGTNGSIFFSDDGVLAEEPIVLVKDGILQPTMMCDRYSFLMMKDRLPGLRQAASGRLESWSHPVYARMTCTYFVPRPAEQGGLSREEMIARTDNAILLERASSGMEDPLGWGIQLQVLHGHEIRSGRLTGRRHYQIGVTGYVPDVLMSVDAIGTELKTSDAGTCGKGHKEWVRNASGGTYLRCRLKLG
ncbi:MAG: TldD/PmbA family protein, partial [candidate division WOR-3 bacterium]